MPYKSLHTYTLERLFGFINGHIIKQEKNIRIVHLRDEKGNSRTLGVVRFLDTNNQGVQDAHGKILAGGLLGKTLLDSKIDFKKEIIGTFQVSLPEWLMSDFETQQNSSFAIFSRISLKSNFLSNEQMLYAELIEVVPPDLEDVFVEKTKPLHKIDKNLLSLIEVADLTVN